MNVWKMQAIVNTAIVIGVVLCVGIVAWFTRSPWSLLGLYGLNCLHQYKSTSDKSSNISIKNEDDEDKDEL